MANPADRKHVRSRKRFLDPTMIGVLGFFAAAGLLALLVLFLSRA